MLLAPPKAKVNPVPAPGAGTVRAGREKNGGGGDRCESEPLEAKIERGTKEGRALNGAEAKRRRSEGSTPAPPGDGRRIGSWRPPSEARRSMAASEKARESRGGGGKEGEGHRPRRFLLSVPLRFID